MLLRKYKLKILFNSNPKFFLLLEMLPVDSKTYTVIKKMLNKSGFEIKYLRTKEALGIMKTLKHSKKEQNSEKTSIESAPQKLMNETIDFNFSKKLSLTSIFKSNLVLIKPLNNMINFQDLPIRELTKSPFLLVGVCFSGLFYNPKTVLQLHQELKASPKLAQTTILNSLNFPAYNTSCLLQNSIIFLALV